MFETSKKGQKKSVFGANSRSSSRRVSLLDDEALCDAPGHGGHDEGGAHVVRSVREGPKKLDLSIL